MKSPNLPDLSLVRVVWRDSNFAPGWINKHRVTASIPSVTSLGYITYQDKKILEISSSIGEEGARLNPLSIPIVSIDTIECLNTKVNNKK